MGECRQDGLFLVLKADLLSEGRPVEGPGEGAGEALAAKASPAVHLPRDWAGGLDGQTM